MYPRPDKPAPWWREALVLTRVVFGVLFWPLVAIVGGIGAIVGLLLAFSIHWAWGLLALALTAGAIAAFAWWDRQRVPPQ